MYDPDIEPVCATCGCVVQVKDGHDWEDGDSCWECTISNQEKEIDCLRGKLTGVREILKTAVCTEGCDKGVVLLDPNGTCHPEEIGGRTHASL